MEQTAKAAQNYLAFSSFSKLGLIEQLEFEDLTSGQTASRRFVESFIIIIMNNTGIMFHHDFLNDITCSFMLIQQKRYSLFKHKMSGLQSWLFSEQAWQRSLIENTL